MKLGYMQFSKFNLLFQII